MQNISARSHWQIPHPFLTFFENEIYLRKYLNIYLYILYNFYTCILLLAQVSKATKDDDAYDESDQESSEEEGDGGADPTAEAPPTASAEAPPAPSEPPAPPNPALEEHVSVVRNLNAELDAEGEGL